MTFTFDTIEDGFFSGEIFPLIQCFSFCKQCVCFKCYCRGHKGPKCRENDWMRENPISWFNLLMQWTIQLKERLCGYRSHPKVPEMHFDCALLSYRAPVCGSKGWNQLRSCWFVCLFVCSEVLGTNLSQVRHPQTPTAALKPSWAETSWNGCTQQRKPSNL